MSRLARRRARPASLRAIRAFMPALLLLRLLFLPACGDSASLEGDPGAHVEQWSADAELRIGSADGPGPLLTRVGAVRIAGDGRLVVSQPQDNEVLVFDGDGELLAVAGGSERGEVPLDGGGRLTSGPPPSAPGCLAAAPDYVRSATDPPPGFETHL